MDLKIDPSDIHLGYVDIDIKSLPSTEAILLEQSNNRIRGIAGWLIPSLAFVAMGPSGTAASNVFSSIVKAAVISEGLKAGLRTYLQA